MILRFAAASSLAALLTIPVGTVSASQIAESDFDYAKINETINLALQEVVTQSGLLNQFRYHINADKTDVSSDKFYSDLTLVAPQTPWGGEEMQVKAEVGFAKVQQHGHDLLQVDLDSHLRTNSVGLLKFLTKTFVKCPVPSLIQGAQRVHSIENCAILEDILAIATLDDAYGLIVKHVQDVKTSLLDYKTALQSQPTSTNEVLDSLIASEMSRTDRMLNNFERFDIQRTKDGILLKSSHIDYGELLSFKDVSVSLKSTGMHVKWQLVTPLGVNIYNAGKPEIIRYLHGLEQGAEYAKELIRMEMRFYLNYFERMSWQGWSR